MNDDELDLWLSTQNENFDARINAKVSVELRRHQVRSATAAEPHDDPDVAEAHAIWSEQAAPTDTRPWRKRVPSAGGLVRRSTTRPASTHPAKRPPTHLSGSRRKPADATRKSAVILVVVLCLLIPSLVVGGLVSWREMASPPGERSRSVVIGVPADMRQETPRYGFAYDTANWLAEALHYSPKTFYSFLYLEDFPDDFRDMMRRGQVDMVVTPTPATDQRGKGFPFAGPYMVTRGGVLIRTDGPPIRTLEDLNGRRVCTWKGSTYKAESMRLGSSMPVEKEILSACVDALLAGGVDAVAGDQILLWEMVKAREMNGLSVVPGVTFGGQQAYGIELAHGNAGECDAVRDAIRRFVTSGAWDRAFQVAMPGVPPAAFKPDPDRLDRCE